MSEVVPGVWAPMDGLSAYDPLMGGYAFLDRTDGGNTYHCGADLNAGNGGDADLGAALRFPVAGEVVYVGWWNGYSTGYGNNLWLRLDSGHYLHYCHCDTMDAWVGMRGVPGQVVATCGKSGYQMWAHLHLEVKREDPAVAGYEYWPYGQPADYVWTHYVRPADWWTELLAWAGREELAMDTTPEERAAMKPYFESLGYGLDVETAIGKLVCLSHKRNETPGPCIGPEYPAIAPDGSQVVRQKFTARLAEAKPLPDGSWWTGYVEVCLHPEALT